MSTTTIDPLGPLWPTLDPLRQEFIIEFANVQAALVEMFDRGREDEGVDKAIDSLASVRREPGFEDMASGDAELESAICRRLMRAILDGVAPPEVDRPELRDHTKAVHLVVTVARHEREDHEDIGEFVRAFAMELHRKIEPPFDLEAVIQEATESVLGDDGPPFEDGRE